MTRDLTPKEEQDLVGALAREYAARRLVSSALPFSLRTQSQLGWLMLEWLGVLVPGAFRQEVRSWHGSRRAGKSAALDAAALVEQYPETVTTRARRLVGKMNESYARSKVRPVLVELDDDPVPDDVHTFTPGEVLSWPNVESMLSGEPPEGYDAALTRAAAESGGAITRVDPERGTVTVSALPETPQMDASRIGEAAARRAFGLGGPGIGSLRAVERESFPSTEHVPDDTWTRCYCSRLVPPSEWSEPHGCCDDCYWALPDSREARAELVQDLDRDRLVDEERD